MIKKLLTKFNIWFNEPLTDSILEQKLDTLYDRLSFLGKRNPYINYSFSVLSEDVVSITIVVTATYREELILDHEDNDSYNTFLANRLFNQLRRSDFEVEDKIVSHSFSQVILKPLPKEGTEPDSLKTLLTRNPYFTTIPTN